MSKDEGKKTILVFLAIMFVALAFLFSIGQIKPVFIANDDINVDVTNNYTLTYKEYKLQIGDSYRTSLDVVVAGGDSAYIGGITEEIYICMCERQLIGISDAEIDVVVNLYEGGEFTGGNLLPNYNRNRNEDENSTFNVYSGITVVSMGDLLPYETFISGDKKVRADSSEEVAYTMKVNETYIIKIDNLGLKSNDLNFVWNWLESSCLD